MRGQAIFLELDDSKVRDLPREYLNERLIPYENGEPKRSLYLSIYRVLEKIPVESMKNLYLVTDDGKVLDLRPKAYKPDAQDQIHLYQQFNPISTRVVSKLSPPEFSPYVKFLNSCMGKKC